MFSTAQIFGLNCQRLDKEENGKQYIKILLMEGGRSDAFTLPFLSKVYIDPEVPESQLTVNQILCAVIPEEHKHYLYALPALKFTIKDQNKFTEEKVRIQCFTDSAIPVSDIKHTHTLSANSLVYFQAVGLGRPTVVVIEKVELDHLHPMSVRSTITEKDQYRIVWRIGQAMTGIFLPTPDYTDIK